MNGIREATEADWQFIWEMFQSVVQNGGEFLHDSIDREDAHEIWFGNNVNPYVVDHEGEIIGAYYLKPNAPGRGSHVANATYVVAESCRGRGVGRAMGKHSIGQAEERGYSAIQFNGVVATNTAAIALWTSLGFQIIGQVPGAFRHQQHGNVDLLIMHRHCSAAETSKNDAGRACGLLERFLHHDQWTTDHLIDRCRQLDESKLDAQHDMGHGTIRETLHHIIHNMEIWSLLISGEPVIRQHDQSLDGLQRRLRIAADRFAHVARQVSARDAWNETWVDHLDDPPRAKRYGTTVAHLITHSMHHRAQLLYMMRRSGLQDLPEGDVFTAEEGKDAPSES